MKRRRALVKNKFNMTDLIEKMIRSLVKGKWGFRLASLYRKYWNPINYAIIGGIGVVINMFVLLSLAPIFQLWFANFIAILAAWLWNWSMSVGPFCYLWGFKPQKEKHNELA